MPSLNRTLIMRKIFQGNDYNQEDTQTMIRSKAIFLKKKMNF